MAFGDMGALQVLVSRRHSVITAHRSIYCIIMYPRDITNWTYSTLFLLFLLVLPLFNLSPRSCYVSSLSIVL